MSIMKWISVIIVVLLFGLAVVVSVQNYVALETPVNLVFFSYKTQEMPLAVVAIFTFAVGVISMGLYGMTVFLRLKKRIRSLTIEAKANEKELNSLRNLPVTTEVAGAEETTDTETKTL